MQKSSIMLALLGLVFALAACERDLEYDLPTGKPQLVANALICADSLLQMEFSISASPGDGEQLRSLKDAKFTLFEGNTLVKDFVLDSMLATPLNFGGNQTASVAPTKLYYFQTALSIGKSGRSYQLEVRYPGLPTIAATTAIPRPMRLRTIPQQLNESILVNGQALDRLVFEIADNGNLNNYFGLEILAFKSGSTDAPEKIAFFSAEKALTENLSATNGQHEEGVFYTPENGVYFSNGKFLGQRKQFEIYVDSDYLNDQTQLQVRVLNLSRDYFEFATTYQRQKQNANNPFAEPTQVYGNVTNGLGIFAGYTITEANF